MGQKRGRHQGIVRDLDAVIYLITLLQAPENGDRILHRRFIHHDRLEPSGQGGIFFDVFPVLIQSGGADAVQFASRQHGLEHIARVHGAVGLSCPYDQMKLIDK